MMAIQSELLISTKATILLVDDQPEHIDVIKSVLDQHFIVKATVRSELVFQICSAGGIDLILLDVMMPGMNGYEVCRQLKNYPATREIPVIFLTSKEGQDDEAVGLELGAVDFIRKPSTPLVVLARCRNTIAFQRAKEDLFRNNAELEKKNIQLQELNKTLKDLVTIDGLTGIPNRRRFDEYLLQEWNRALRDRSPISLIVMDIDYFKLFNDNYGHAAGDECLKKVAQTLAASMVRAIDLMARYGGEEFVCILPKTNASGLVKVGNHLRDSINSLYIVHGYSIVAPYVTISLGGATMIPSQEISPFLLVSQADAKLYKAKEGGRNRLVVE
ncbi:MAG: diguanylate cyclase [Magnetococcus sp. YQC-5]